MTAELDGAVSAALEELIADGAGPLRLADLPAAIIRLRRVIAACPFREPEGRVKAAAIRAYLADALRLDGKLDQSWCVAHRSLDVLEKLAGATGHAAVAYRCLGLIAQTRNRPKEWVQFQGKAVDQWRRLPVADERNLALALDGLGLAQHEVEDLDAAIESYRDALAHAQGNLGSDEIRQLEVRLANCYQDAGHLDRAVLLYERATPPADASASEQFKWVHGRAMLAERMGEPTVASACYREAVTLLPRQDRPHGSALNCLINAALWFAGLDPAEARRLRRRFLRWAKIEKVAGAALQAAYIDAVLANATDNLPAALRHWRKAVRLARMESPQNVPSITVELAAILSRLGRRVEAIALLEQCWQVINERTASPRELSVAITLGAYLVQETAAGADRTGLGRAELVLRRALAGEALRGMPEAEWRILAGLADAAAALGRGQSAITLGKAALQIIRRASPSKDWGTTDERVLPHRKLSERLVSVARFAEATRVQSVLSQQLVFELAQRDRYADRRNVEVAFRPDEQVVVAAYQQHCDRLRRLRFDSQRPEQRHEDSTALVAEIESTQKSLSSWLDEVLAQRPEAPHCAAPLREVPNDMPPPRSGVLHFLRHGDRWRGLLRTSSQAVDYDIAGSAAEIANAIFDFRARILGRDGAWRGPASALFDRILGPAASCLDELDRLEVVPDGPFSHLPFAALHDGRRCLVDSLDLSTRTGIAVSDGKARTGPPVRLLGALDSDQTGLVHVKAELDAIAALRPDIPEPVALTEQSLAEALGLGTRIVHIASHFVFDPARPDDSHLELDGGGHLSLAAFRSARFDLSGVDLLVLSACNTGTTPQGTFGPESFAGLAQSKGARFVLGTLWRVGDASTARIMERFYSLLLQKEPISSGIIAGALRQAASGMAMISGTPAVSSGIGAGSDDYSHPYHWAGYALFGQDPA